MATSRNVSPERHLLAAAVVSLAVAAIASQVPMLSFGSFITMAIVLVAADVVVYVLMKLGMFRSSVSE